MAEMQDVLNAATEIRNEVDCVKNDVTSMTEKSVALEKSLNEKLENQDNRLKALEDQLFSVQQKSVKVDKMEQPKDFGSRLILNENFKNFSQNLKLKSNNVRIELASPLGTTTSNSVSVNTFSTPYNAGIVTDPKQILSIEQLFGKIAVDGSTYTYTHLNNGDVGAAVVAEGAAKPESTYEGEVLIGKVETVAHWTKITEQLLADNSNIVNLINTDMAYQVNKLVDKEILVGTGVGQLGGLTKTGNYTDYNTLAGLASGDTLIDVVRKVLFAMKNAAIDNVTLILNPMDWCKVLGTKNANKDYLIPGIVDLAGQRIYGIPVVLSSAVVPGTYYMGDFYQGAKIFERSGIAVELAREKDDFTKNLYTLRVERRLGFSVVQPKAISYGTFAEQP